MIGDVYQQVCVVSLKAKGLSSPDFYFFFCCVINLTSNSQYDYIGNAASKFMLAGYLCLMYGSELTLAALLWPVYVGRSI